MYRNFGVNPVNLTKPKAVLNTMRCLSAIRMPIR